MVTGAGLRVLEIVDRSRTVIFKDADQLRGYISSWFGGFKSFEKMPDESKKVFMAALVQRFLYYNKPNNDGSIDYSGRHIMVKAQKPG